METGRQLDKPATSSASYLGILICFVVVVCYLAAKSGTTVVIPPQIDWTIWPGNVFVACILLLVPRRIWPLIYRGRSPDLCCL
jgi:hypothetical protein